MKHRIVIDIDGKNEFRTIVIEMVNTIERPNVYSVYTEITNGYKTIYEKKEVKGHEQALKYMLTFKNFLHCTDCVGFEVKHKQTFITEKNPYISKMEYIKRFLWE